MTVILDIVSWLLIVVGGLSVIVGGIGVLRMPDVYTRAHAASITDTLGAGLILIGLMVQGGFTLATVKLVMILAFILFTGPTATHALIHTVHASGIEPILDGGEGSGEDPP